MSDEERDQLLTAMAAPDRDTGRLTRTSGHSAARTPSLRCALSSADSRRAMWPEGRV